MSKTLAQRFFERFTGLSRSHGTYAVGVGLSKKDNKGKLTGARRTVHAAYTAELWEKHLGGTYAIGVVPIREDNSARFGAIDIDDYSLDLKALNARIRKLELPLILCRTKSGGAHLYLFTDEPVPAELMRDKLVEWAIVLGHAGVEVFPKQTRLAGPNDPVEDATGNWINMPYAEGEITVRYALDPKTGDALDMEEFLRLADKLAVSGAAALKDIEPAADPIDELLRGAPPCLVTLATRGFGDWQNNGLFNVAKYLQLRYPADWEERVYTYNQHFMADDPVPAKDVAAIIKSLHSKKYSYMCKQDPICKVCDKKVCRTREFGVGGLPDDAGVTFGTLIKLKTEPVTWIWPVNSARLEIDTETLMDQRRFHKACVEKLSIWPTFIKPATWQNMVREAMAVAEEFEVPEDATKEGQLLVYLGRFCGGRVTAKAMDEILMGKPFTDEENKRTYFQAADFLQFLQQHRFSGMGERDVWRILSQRYDAKHTKMRLKGKSNVVVWDVPAFSQQTEEHVVPRVAPPEKM